MSKARELADLLDSNGDVQADALDTQPQLGRRNLIINGDFRVSQRGDYTSATTFNDNSLALDRWYMSIGAGSATIQQLTSGAKMVATSSYDGNLQFRQKVERLNIDTLVGKTVTLSAKIKTNNATDCRLLTYNGSWSTGSALHSGSGEFEILTYTFTMPPDGGYGSLICGVGIDGNGSASVSVANGDYIEVEYVQLELGSVATPFEHRSYGEELALCQRYYQNYHKYGSISLIYNLATTVSTSGYPCHTVALPTPMRSSPTITIYSWSNDVVGSVYKILGADKGQYAVIIASTPEYFTIQPSGTPQGVGVYWGHYTADAEL
jgi:hypothetical protein